MLLEDWALRHGIGHAALEDLRASLFALDTSVAEVVADRPQGGHMSESAVQQRVRLEAVKKGVRLWRNNVGVLEDERGVPVRYGLANDSKALNAVLKSADLIGIRPILIGAEHVGKVIGQFVSREVKAGGWTYSGTPREIAQHNWAALVRAAGGDACFANAEGTL